jgi:hypothetical protein
MNGKYLKDFDIWTDDINQAAFWFKKKDVLPNFRENGVPFRKKYVIQKCDCVFKESA